MSLCYCNTMFVSSLPTIPPKVQEALKHYRYVPYIALSVAARLKAVSDDDNLVLSAAGTFTVKGLDRGGEKAITMVEWYAAASAVESRIRFHHGDLRGDAFAGHHRVVLDIARTHLWE
ncbi:hypothetical protein C8F04DRAFT_1181353, partial [Mycena alexandri]